MDGMNGSQFKIKWFCIAIYVKTLFISINEVDYPHANKRKLKEIFIQLTIVLPIKRESNNTDLGIIFINDIIIYMTA